MESRYVFLDPDGSVHLGLQVVVRAATSVVYAHQCGALAREVREVEGYLVPVGTYESGQRVREFFKKRHEGKTPAPDRLRSEELATLRALLRDVSFWHTEPRAAGHEDRPTPLLLDGSRLEELTEGWIPVQTVAGPGVLLFDSSE